MAAIASLKNSLDQIPAPAWVGFHMIVYALLAATANGIIRHLGQTFPMLEVALFINVFALLAVLPTVLRKGLASLRTTRHGLYLARGCSTAFHTLCLTYAFSLLPIDKATALNFTVPVFATIGAALFLGERIGARRWTAVAIGVIGSLIIIRPGLTAYEPGSTFPLLAAAAMAVTLLMVKSLSRTEPPYRVVFYMGLYASIITLIPAAFVWVKPTPAFLAWAVLMGTLTGCAQLMATRAFARADASFAAPFDFFRLPFGAIVGLIAFGELMDLLGWVGAVVIFASGLYIVHQEVSVGPVSAATPPPADTGARDK